VTGESINKSAVDYQRSTWMDSTVHTASSRLSSTNSVPRCNDGSLRTVE